MSDSARGTDSLVFAGLDVVGSLGASISAGEHASFYGVNLDEEDRRGDDIELVKEENTSTKNVDCEVIIAPDGRLMHSVGSADGMI